MVRFKSPKLHIYLAVFWGVAFVPIAMFWPESVLLVLFISCYANFVGHLASFEAANSAGVDEATHRKLNAIADGLADLMDAVALLLPADATDCSQAAIKLKQDRDELRQVVGLERQNDDIDSQ